MLTNKVREIMTGNITTAEADWTVSAVLAKMVAEDVGRIVITDGEVPVGIFTEKDVLRRVVDKLDPAVVQVREVMTKPLQAVKEETRIVDAFGRMYKGKYRHLLVRGRRGKIVGIVSMRRILGLAVELGQGMSDPKTVGSIMAPGAPTVDESVSVHDVIERMAQEGHGAVVVTSAGEPAGIFTERDVLKRVAAPGLDTAKTAVRAVMTAPLITMESSALVRDVLAEMYRRDIRNMPVTGPDGKLAGIVAMPEVLQYASAFDIDERVRQAWKEVQEYFDSEDQYTPG
ncbi:MAG TPA: CBS domain-containing protein [candidate division Zixibacteria bacterium]|nr:CBS domain-containing protein [candidate division Zixibacteria bacterium]